MKSRWLLNIALIFLVGILVWFAVSRSGSKTESPGPPLTALAPESVERIRLLRPRQPEVLLERNGTAWSLRAPRTARANPYRAGELTRLAAARASTRFPAKPGELGQYGLDNPVATVFLNDTELRFGGMHPLKGEIYVQQGDQVFLIPAAPLRAVSSPLDELLSPALLEDPVKIASLQFPGFSLKQNEQGAWLRTPEMKDLGSDAIHRFVDEWRHARALSVQPFSGKPAKERVRIAVVEDAGPRTLEFSVAARKPELVLVRLDEGLAYHFPADAVTRLLELKPDPSTASSR